MHPTQQRSILAIALHAAFADGAKHDREREAGVIVDLSEMAAPAVATGTAAAAAPGPAVAASPKVTEAKLDKSILNHALLNGALELLPQSWASLAIIPLQVKMVYGIGKAHGVALDQGPFKEFIAAAGVGLTSALGQVAKRYYAGGRVMSTALLRDAFQSLLGPAKQLQAQYLPQIQQKVSTLDAGRIMSLVRGG
jgi:uncharacterized protein (DUF697 family)